MHSTERVLADILTYTLTRMNKSSRTDINSDSRRWVKRKVLVWRKVQKGTFINNTFVIKHHEFSTQVMLMTRSWNQTKNSNLRHIATGYLRTYKSKNSREAIATVRIARDNKHIYTYIYIWTSLNECTRITRLKPFCSAKLKHGDFGSLQTEWNKTDSPWCPLSLLDSFFEVSQIEIPFQTNEALCFANFSPLVPRYANFLHSYPCVVRKFWGTREGGYKILGKGFLNPPRPPLELVKCPLT